jgi:hypothetical protein
MTDAQRAMRERQLRVLVACGERGHVLRILFGVSARTIKRLYRKTAAVVPGGRTPGPPPGWRGRDRDTVEQLLQVWLHEGLEKILAGEAPFWLQQLALRFGLGSPAQIAAIFQRVHVPTDERAGEDTRLATARIHPCPGCNAPVVSVQRAGHGRASARSCGSARCRQAADRRATQPLRSADRRSVAAAMEHE